MNGCKTGYRIACLWFSRRRNTLPDSWNKTDILYFQIDVILGIFAEFDRRFKFTKILLSIPMMNYFCLSLFCCCSILFLFTLKSLEKACFLLIFLSLSPISFSEKKSPRMQVWGADPDPDLDPVRSQSAGDESDL